ncbi:MAG TPA: aminopeptidase N [Acidimicrobiales bacterium]|nr:aminopeptidase N [Acidimicrobiales bacterium]
MTSAQEAVDNLTRAEAQDRASKLSSVSYAVALDLTTGDETFTSDTTVRFQGNLVGLTTFIDLDAGNVREASLNGRVIPVESYDKGRSRIPLRGLLANNVVRVVADCAYQHTGVGLHRFADPTDGKVYLHTQFEPYDAHRVFACFDQPDIKATFNLTINAPDDWTVVSNSPSTREGSEWRFSPTEVISTYLVAVVAGPYHVVRETHGQVDMGIYCRESLAEYLDAEDLFTLTRQGLDFFEAEFDYPYPFSKYDQLFVPEFNFGAMENPGCVTFNESMVFRSRQTESAYEGRANTLLHEMAHMWFGDLVTMRWWDDLWLNESFATYMAYHALSEATRFSDSWVRFAAGVKAGAMAQDQLPTTHPISADIVDTDAVRLHFDGITYLKGASTLKQLVAWVGQDAFRQGLQRYFRQHEWSNAELADFLSTLEQTSGRKLTQWSEEWLETAGVNTLRAELSGDAAYDSFTILQQGQPGNDTIRSHRVAVGLYRLGDDGLVRDRRLELDVVGERTEVPELSGEAVPDLLLLNDDDLTYAKVRLDDRSVATLADHLSRIVDPLARNLCWAATWDMVRDAELPTRRYVDLVLAHAPAENDDSTLARLLGQADVAVDVYGDPANHAAARAALAAAARTGLAAAEPGTDRQLIWARHFQSVAGSTEDLAYARGLLDGTQEVPGLAVDTDLRWQIVMTLASLGADDDGALIEAELERDPTDIGERRAASARASRPTAEAKAAAWSRLVDEKDLPLATLRAVAGGFGVHGQDELLAAYVEPYFGNVARFWEERTRDEALSLIGGLYPRTLIGQNVLDATDAVLADDALPGPVRRILLEGRDGMARALRARAADRPA